MRKCKEKPPGRQQNVKSYKLFRDERQLNVEDAKCNNYDGLVYENVTNTCSGEDDNVGGIFFLRIDSRPVHRRRKNYIG